MLTTMLPADFCLWLKGVLDRRTGSLTPEETTSIREALACVFRHEIDPMMGDEAHQTRLNKIHSGDPRNP